MPVVFAFNRQGSDDLTLYHGPSRGFASVNFMPAQTACASEDFLINISDTCEDGASRAIDMAYVQPNSMTTQCICNIDPCKI